MSGTFLGIVQGVFDREHARELTPLLSPGTGVGNRNTHFSGSSAGCDDVITVVFGRGDDLLGNCSRAWGSSR